MPIFSGVDRARSGLEWLMPKPQTPLFFSRESKENPMFHGED